MRPSDVSYARSLRLWTASSRGFQITVAAVTVVFGTAAADPSSGGMFLVVVAALAATFGVPYFYAIPSGLRRVRGWAFLAAGANATLIAWVLSRNALDGAIAFAVLVITALAVEHVSKHAHGEQSADAPTGAEGGG